MDKEAIYREFGPKIEKYVRFKVANPEDAKDISSEVFAKVFEKITHFDMSKASLSTWIYTIARNTVIDYYRTRRAYDVVEDEMIGSTESTPEDDFLNSESLKALSDALNQLKYLEKSIIVYKYYYGMKQQEIADKLQISLPYVKLLQKNALEKLKDILG